MRHFSHELKSVLRDYAVPLALPTLIVSGSLYFWNDEWAMTVARPDAALDVIGGLIRALVYPIWPYLEKALWFGGWAIPFLVLKNADIHDALATWKTRPVSRRVVFTARFLALAVAYVALPAAATWLICRCSWPEIADGQTVKVAGVGAGMVLLGAFAAMVAPGRRGIAILGGLAATAYAIAAFGPDIAKWILNKYVLHLTPARDYSVRGAEFRPLSGEWMAMVSLLTMTALVVPWIVARILRSGGRPRVLPWFGATVLLGLVFQSALFLAPGRKTPMVGPVLPVATVELKDWKTKPTPRISAMGSGRFFGSGNMRLPESGLRITTDELEEATPRRWAPREWRNQHAYLTGSWETDTMGGRIEDHFHESRPGVSASWYENEWGSVPGLSDERLMGDFALRPLATTLGVPAVKIWTAMNCAISAGCVSETKPDYAWADSATFRQKPQLVGFDFGIPFGDTPPGERCIEVVEPKLFYGKTVRFRVDMQLARDLPPEVWMRIPVLRGGEKITDSQMLRIEPAEPSDRRFYTRGAYRQRPLAPWYRHHLFLPKGEDKGYLLFNAARGEGVFLCQNGSMYWGDGALVLPKNAPPLSDEWVAGAEIVVLKYRSEPVVLPVEGSIKVRD